MIKEAIEKVVALAVPTVRDGKPGYVLSDRALNEYDTRKAQADHVPVSTLSALVSTLSALVDLITAKLNDLDSKNAFIRVAGFDEVKLQARIADDFGRRDLHVVVNLPKAGGFAFGQFQDQESFLIGVMANFTDKGDREYVLNLASKITAERVVTAEDNGVAQTVGLKKGAALKTTEMVKQRVTLAPFRTFREVEQPASEFIFRVRQGEEGGIPQLALFEADGGKWKLDAAAAVRDWFKGKVGDIPVVA